MKPLIGALLIILAIQDKLAVILVGLALGWAYFSHLRRLDASDREIAT